MKSFLIFLLLVAILPSLALSQTTTTQSLCGNSYCDFYETKSNCASDCTFTGANCNQGAIPSTGCTCNRGNAQGYTNEYSGYCCWGSYSPTPCATELKTCIDSDVGMDVYVKGSGSGNYKGATIRAYQTYDDVCATSTQLNEAYCEASSGMLSVAGLVCSNGCKDGVCLQPATTTSSSSTTTSTIAPTTTTTAQTTTITATVIQSTVTGNLSPTSDIPPPEPTMRQNEVRPTPALPVEPVPQPGAVPMGKSFYPHKDFPISKEEFEIEKLYVSNENPGIKEKIEITCITSKESDIITFKIYSPNGKTDKIWGTLAWGITIPYDNLDSAGKYDVECIVEGYGKQLIKSISFNVGGSGGSSVAAPKSCMALPQNLKENCEGGGGKIYLEYDKKDSSCITKFNCIRPENETQIREEVEREEISVPNTDVLLELAFKLEDVKLSFTQLSQKSNAVASYYVSAEKPGEAQKFQKIAASFEAAGGKVQEIEDFMRSKLEDFTKEDAIKVRQDLAYIRKIVLKDILYQILSKAEEVSTEGVTQTSYPQSIPFPTAPPGQEPSVISAPAASGGGGGVAVAPQSGGLCSDMYSCWLEGFRLCKTGSEYSHTEKGTFSFEVIGFDGKNCMINAKLTISGDPTAKCTNSDYALGFKSEFDFFRDSKCEGALKDFLDKNPMTPPLQVSGSGQCASEYDCFDKGLQACKQGVKRSAFRKGAYAFEIIGLEGNVCVVKAELTLDQAVGGETMEAKCKDPYYTRGFRGEPTFFRESKCEGSLDDFHKKMNFPGNSQ